MKFFFIFLFSFFFFTKSYSQYSRYVIQLKDKTGTPYSIDTPSKFLTQRAIDRRLRYNIPVDSSDLPIVPRYLDSIANAGGVTILNYSRWFNQVSIRTYDTATINKINSFSFVVNTAPVAARPSLGLISRPAETDSLFPTPLLSNQLPDVYSYGLAFGQVNMHEGEFLHNHGFRGEGMILTVTDDGFYEYDSLPTFDSARTNKQILGTWDFVGVDSNVNYQDYHGTECFSIIAANMPGTFVGTAPMASYYLYRSEDYSSEFPVEMHNWVAAAERADSLGSDVISVSLGYTTFDSSMFNFTYANMNGDSTIIASAANMATRKGMLVVVAAGNDGTNSWHYVSTPGDADSALTVGAVDITGTVADFSSYGPNSSGQIKPDVASLGVYTVVADPLTGMPSYGDGTSFATPIIAGLSTCLWQAFPEVRSLDIITALQQSSNQSANPDNRIGYGIPDFMQAFVYLIEKLHTMQAAVSNCNAVIQWTAKSASDMNFIVQRKMPGDTGYAAIDTVSATSGFVSNNFTVNDDLSAYPSMSNIQYRIQMNIASDTSFYLDSANVNFINNNCPQPPVEKIVIAPNPVNDNLTVQVVRDNPVTVSVVLFSSDGKKIREIENQSQPAGSSTYNISTQLLSRGVYVVAVFVNNQKAATQKIVH